MINIEEILNESQNISDLECKLEKEGIKFRTTFMLSAFLYGEWLKLQENKIKTILEEAPECEKGLNYTEVTKNGKIYRIHGIIHGNDFYLPASAIKKHINESIAEYINDKEDYLIEEDFGEFLNIDKSHEMRVKYKIREKLLIKYIMANSRLLVEESFNKLILKVFLLAGYGDDTMIRAGELTYKTLEDISAMRKFHKVRSLIKLPEPFDMQLQQRTSKEIFIYMSYLMAKEMVKYANNNKLNILHCITGFFHESQIAYYLNNLEYNPPK